MLLTVVTPAPTRALTTVDRLRASIDTNEDDDRLLRRIRTASAMVETHCRRVFARERVRETFTMSGLRNIALARAPVAEIHSLTVGGVAREYVLANSSAGLLQPAAGHEDMWLALGMPRVYDHDPAMTPTVIEYTGGYITSAWPDDIDTGVPPEPDLPAAIEDAVIETVRGMIDYAAPATDIQTERLGDYSVTYRDTSRGGPGLSPDVISLLAPYRAVLL